MQYKVHELAVLKCSFGSLFVYYICFIVFLDHLNLKPSSTNHADTIYVIWAGPGIAPQIGCNFEEIPIYVK